MSRRKDELLWRAKMDRMARSAQDLGDSDSESDEVADYLLERERIAASTQERHALDQYLACLHRIEFAGGLPDPDADEAATFSLGEA